jgi:uncharacterized membrane protein
MSSDKTGGRTTGLVFSPWNLLLLLPFIVLFTPIYNRETPTLFGMPFFYWFQFAVIFLGVLSTITVYRMTRNKPVARASAEARDVDQLDEGRAG